jgi:hypothetical protein
MRRAVIAALVGLTLVLSAATSYGVEVSATATAALQVGSVLTLVVEWESSGTDHTDHGIVPNNTVVMDQLIGSVTHNMGASQFFSLSFVVDEPVGPAWDSMVEIDDGVGTLEWYEGDFGTSQTFPTPIGGAEVFAIAPYVNIHVSGTQANDLYQFEVTMTITSL